MSCEQVRNLVHELPRAEWSSEQLELVERHISTCADCRLRLELEARLESSLGAFPEPEPPPSLADEIMARVTAHHVSHAKAPSRARQIGGDIAKSAGIAIGLGAHVYRVLENGTLFKPPRIGEALDMLVAGSLWDPLMLTFMAGVILYLVGLFVPLRSLEYGQYRSGKPG
jgi:hypothetical protein